jgi:hypothetical protein
MIKKNIAHPKSNNPKQVSKMSENQQQYVLSIMCCDRVGLVYEISKAISELITYLNHPFPSLG